MKEPKCSFCGGKHYQTFCPRKPRKPLKTNKPLRAKKPLPSYTKPLQRKPLKQRKRLKQQSTNPRPVAVKDLDRVFSIYIRVKDSIHEIATCVTCGAKGHWRSMQNGHFIGRRNMSVRWDEMNCHVQCSYCNETLSGNLGIYEQFMINKYGEQALEQLRLRARDATKLPISDIIRLTELYTERLRIMQKSIDLK